MSTLLYSLRLRSIILMVFGLTGLISVSGAKAQVHSGSWMTSGHEGAFLAYCDTDSMSQIVFTDDHMNSMMGTMWPDSTEIHFWSLETDSLPGHPDHNMLSGFYFEVTDPFGHSMMDGTWGGSQAMMTFGGEHKIQFHYYDEDLQGQGLTEDGLGVEYWDEMGGMWRATSDVDVNMIENTVSFSSQDLARFYALVSNTVATVTEYGSDLPESIQLFPNYPNPFNPQTTISYTTASTANVRLTIYDMLGRRIAALVNGMKAAGLHTVKFDASGLGSGVYLYRLESGSLSLTRSFTLLE